MWNFYFIDKRITLYFFKLGKKQETSEIDFFFSQLKTHFCKCDINDTNIFPILQTIFFLFINDMSLYLLTKMPLSPSDKTY